MKSPNNAQTSSDKLKFDYDLFKEKFDSLPDTQKHRQLARFERLETDLKLENLKGSHEKTNEFYRLFAEFTEDSNAVKMLYQVLLEEYYRTGVFTKKEGDDLRETAVEKIKTLLEAGVWHGIGRGENRARFRFEMLELLRTKVHEKSALRANQGERVAALCFSGGGIRSATFGLGVLQGLAKHGLLKQFDYISTVSGGGYIGSWLSAWIYRVNRREDDEGNIVDDRQTPEIFSNADAIDVEKLLVEQNPVTPEPEEITHLRSYSNYMSPRTGLFSTDTWTLIAVYLRNLLLNWTVFVPLIAAFLLLPKIFATVLGSAFNDGIQTALLIVGLIAGIGGVMNINAMRPSLKKYSWVDQTFKENDIGIYKSVESKVFRWVFLWILVFALCLTIFWVWTNGSYHFPYSAAVAAVFRSEKQLLGDFIIFSLILFLGGYLLAWLFMLRKFLRVKQEEKAKGEVKAKGEEKLSLRRRLMRFYSVYLSEIVSSVACGIIAGALLFLVVDKLEDISRVFYGIVDARVIENKTTTLTPEFYASFGVPLLLFVFLLAATLFVGLAVRFTDDEDREWLARLGALILMLVVCWSAVSTAVLFGPLLFVKDWSVYYASVGGISGLVTLVLGFSSKSAAKTDAEPKTKKSFLLWFAPAVAAPVFVLFLVILIAYLTEALIVKTSIVENYRHLTWFVILAGIGAVMGYFININKFSIHSIYRERLIRAYLGASRTKRRLFTANSFTGLDSEHDNLEMRVLKQKPLHVVNMTLNLVKTQNLRWQNRKAESFTATALYCGSSNMGDGSGNYRSSEDYGLNAQNSRAITLGTAAAVSGAAASPNMGYYSMSAAVSFLMVLFNVRLGWWLGNPGRRGERTYNQNSSFFEKLYVKILTAFNLNKTYNQPAPRWSPRLFLDESIGGTDDSKPYVYLSDGGHFENLGLYEMVLRRCSLIVVSDAACDADFGFSDFGTAIHKIRVDMGIPIEFAADRHPMKTRNCGIGIIKYSCVDKTQKDGILIYIKPTLDGDEPIDLKNYKKENPDFPHESTADQMYSETQFESYRSLGFHQITSICCKTKKCSCENLADLESNAAKYLEDLAENRSAR